MRTYIIEIKDRGGHVDGRITVECENDEVAIGRARCMNAREADVWEGDRLVFVESRRPARTF
jgi:hypothetical protein